MKKILLALSVSVIMSFQASFADTEIIADNIDSNELFEEVVLSTPQIQDNEEEAVHAIEINSNKTFKEKLKNVYNLEVEKYDHPEYLFRDALTHKCEENSIMDSWHIWGAYNGFADLSVDNNGDFSSTYKGNAHNIGFDGFLKNNNGDFRIMMGFPSPSARNYTQTLFSDVFFATNKIPHHRIQVGHFRPQVGMEGGNSAYTLPFLGRSQIARNFGTARRLGGRIQSDYSFIDYDFGIYSSDTFFENWFSGPEFIGCVNFKPLANFDEKKYGKLKIGGGIDGGKREDSFFVTGAYIGYEYKKFMADFEWASANGYNGYYGYSRKHATGFYTTIGYMLTKKLQVLACYDQFTPDKNFADNKQREMSFGINYFIKGQALRLIFNYVFCQKDAAKDSHKILLGIQILK